MLAGFFTSTFAKMIIDARTCGTSDQEEAVHKALMGAWGLAGFVAGQTADTRNMIVTHR